METIANLGRNKKFLIFGGGFSGKYFANEIRKIGLKALTSSRSKNDRTLSFLFDSNLQELPPDNIFDGVTHILSCIPPNKDGKDPLLLRLKEKLLRLNLDWAGYLSTTGVYGNTNGEWVSEKDPTNPQQERSKRRLLCEQSWIDCDLPSQIFRLPGIYGPGRSTLESIMHRDITVIHKEKQVFSRIHVEDISNAIIYLLQNKDNLTFHQIINIADNKPSPQIDVIKYSYDLLGLEMPKPILFEDAKQKLSPIALSFWEENRRVSNDLLCEELGYNLIHKDYKSGLKSCLSFIKAKKLI